MLTEPVSNFSKVDKQGFNIKWVKDNNFDSLLIMTNISRDSSLPDFGYPFFSDHGWYKSVPDNGEFLMTSSILNSLTINDTLSISLYRIKVDTVSNKEIFFVFKRILSDKKEFIIK